MNAKTRENRTNQQERTSRQKRSRGESFGNDELTTGDYEKETLANSRARDLKSGTKKAKAPSSVQKNSQTFPWSREGAAGSARENARPNQTSSRTPIYCPWL